MLIRPGKRFAALLLVTFFVGAHLGAVDKTTADLIDKEIKKHIREIIKTRRFLHMNPELGNREFETSKLVASKLLFQGLEVKTGIAKTGVVGLLQGDYPGFAVGLRADMDALPIQEKNQVPYASLNPGVMHACGHDIHTAVALGTAVVLSNLKDRIHGTVKFIFQPAEEGPPAGEEGGASLMIREGVLEDPALKAIFGLHVWPEIEVGQVRFSPGSVLASADSFEVAFMGKSSHGARPYEGVDSILLSSQFILALHSAMSRTVDPLDPAVVSVGKIEGGIRSNIIAEEVRLAGTARTMSETSRVRIESLIENIADGVTRPLGASYEFRYRRGAPPVYNHPELAAVMRPTLVRILGNANVFELPPQMVAEDFSEFCQKIPGFYFLLGVKSPSQESMPPLHSPDFDPDERSIAVGIRLLSHLVLDSLEHPNSFAAEIY
jgi:amidohydrolase